MDIVRGKEIPATFWVTEVDEEYDEVWGSLRIKGEEVFRDFVMDLKHLEELMDPVKKINKLEKQKQEIQEQINKLRQEKV